jgi:hypothetical protein
VRWRKGVCRYVAVQVGSIERLAKVVPTPWRVTGTVAVDISGNGSNGTYTGGFTLGAVAVFGVNDADTAISLNGTTGRVTLPNINVPGTISVEAWVKPANTVQDSKIIGRHTNTADMNGTLGISGGKYFFEITAGGVYKALSSLTSVVANVWTHVVATYDGTTQRIYVNGVLDNSQAASGALGNAARGWAVGAVNATDSANWYNGLVDEAAVYPTALSGARIAAHYAAAFAAGTFARSNLLADVSPFARRMFLELTPLGEYPSMIGPNNRIRKSGTASKLGAQKMNYSADTFPFTISLVYMWDGTFNPANAAADYFGMILNKNAQGGVLGGLGSSTGQFICQYRPASDGIESVVFDCNGSAGNNQEYRFMPLQPLVPYHFVWTVNPGGIRDVWVNGVKKSTQGVALSMDVSAGTPWTIGQRAASVGSPGNCNIQGGYVQHVAFFPRVLADVTIQYLYAVQFGSTRNGYDYEGDE